MFRTPNYQMMLVNKTAKNMTTSFQWKAPSQNINSELGISVECSWEETNRWHQNQALKSLVPTEYWINFGGIWRWKSRPWSARNERPVFRAGQLWPLQHWNSSGHLPSSKESDIGYLNHQQKTSSDPTNCWSQRHS